jgi:hypothetical protein
MVNIGDLENFSIEHAPYCCLTTGLGLDVTDRLIPPIEVVLENLTVLQLLTKSSPPVKLCMTAPSPVATQNQMNRHATVL